MDFDFENEMIKALKRHAEGKIAMAKATAQVYMNRPVGIGEHPQHFEEMDKLVESMTAARDKLEVLNEEYPDPIKLV